MWVALLKSLHKDDSNKYCRNIGNENGMKQIAVIMIRKVFPQLLI
jgi:hypothetical protein